MWIYVFLSGILILFLIYGIYFIWIQETTSYKKIQLTISCLTFSALCVAGIFTYYKYEDYRKESNYQKVITRYLDNNIDVSNSEMSHYIMKVSSTLMLYCDEKCGIGDIAQRKEIYVKDTQNLAASLIKLSVFDVSIHISYSNVFTVARSVLRLTLDETTNKKLVENNWNLIEPFYRFVTYNLQDLGELIRKDTKAYDSPNLESIKKTSEFKKIIDRFKEFNKLFDDGKALNDGKNREKLLYFVSEYLKSKGVPCEVTDANNQ